MLSTIFQKFQTAIFEATKNTLQLFKPAPVPIKIRQDEMPIPKRSKHQYKRR